MSETLARWNRLPPADAAKDILPCCGSTAWADGMAARRPLWDEASLLAASDETWRSLAKADWREAFRGHPRIGESRASPPAPAQSSAWSKQEQQDVAAAGEVVKINLARANDEYERRFGHIFIVCATGKSGPEILEILRRRLRNDQATELQEAAKQQLLITQIRLKKWLSQ
jgi:2-oxo-4-hydroxy-4-carboxy-5-ureidoimidazoline decarboxylase